MTQDTNITLEQVAARFRSGNSAPVERAHITAEEWQAVEAAYAELREENERLKSVLKRFSICDQYCGGNLEYSKIVESVMRESKEVLASSKTIGQEVESQLAALQAGGEAVCPVCGSKDSLPEPANGTCAHCYNHMAVTQAPASVQPAIAGKVPPGYAVVPTFEQEQAFLSKATYRIEHGEDVVLENLSECLQAMLASAPAIQPQPAAPAVVPEGFYLASFKNGRSNGTMCWWGPKNCGYTPYLEQAGIYTTEEIEVGYHDNEYTVPVPVAYARQQSVSLVDVGLSDRKQWWSAESLRAALSAAPNTQEKGEG